MKKIMNQKPPAEYFYRKTLSMKKTENNSRKTRLPLAGLNKHELTGNEDHQISLQEASELTKAYRKENPGGHKAEFFGKDALLAILSQKNCVGIRIYYGVDPKTGEQHLVLVGAEPNKNDIEQGIIAERGLKCPSCCGIKNSLNS